MSFIRSLLSIGPMSHVDFKKWQCRCVEFRGQGPQPGVTMEKGLPQGAWMCACPRVTGGGAGAEH